MFFCHLSIEKIIKALVVKNTKEIPPKSHDLFNLSDKADIQINDEQKEFLRILMKYQLEGRYSEHYPDAIYVNLVNDYLNKTKNIFAWFSQKL